MQLRAIHSVAGILRAGYARIFAVRLALTSLLFAFAAVAQAGGGSLGDLATLTSPETFSDTNLPTSGSFADDWTFNLSEPVSGGASVTSLDVVFDPSSSSGFNFTGLQTLSVSVYDSQTTLNSSTLVTSQTVTNPTVSTADNIAFDNLSTSNLYTLVVSGTPVSGTVSAAYTGVIAAEVVPEPASWALLIAGFGLGAGVLLLRRRRSR